MAVPGAITRPRSSFERIARGAAIVACLALSVGVIILYAQLAKRARFTPDDLCVFSSVEQRGFLAAQRLLFESWSGRWASNFFVTAAMSVLPASGSLRAYSLCLLGFTTATAAVVLKALFRERIDPPTTIALALTSIAFLFLVSPHRGDSWFFAYASIENVWPMCFGALAFACVRQAYRGRGWVAAAILLAALATAGHQCVALSFLAAGGIGVAWMWVALSHAPLSGAADRRRRAEATAATAAFVAGLASFVVCVSAPGDRHRLAYLRPATIPDALRDTIAGAPSIVGDIVAAHPMALVSAALVWLVAGLVLIPAEDRVGGRRLAVRLSGAAAVLSAIGLVSSFPGYYALHGPPPTRAQIALAGAVVVVAAFSGLQLARVLPRRSDVVALATVALVLALAWTFARERAGLVRDIALARTYAAAYDGRMAFLRERRSERVGPIVLAPLPESGLLRSAEISAANPRAYENTCLRGATGLAVPVLREP